MPDVMDLADIKNVSIFAEQLGSEFRIEIGTDQFVATELIEAEALDAGTRSSELPSREPFSLLFQIDGDIDLRQQTYRVHHDSIGELMLFLVPVGAGKLESIFN